MRFPDRADKTAEATNKFLLKRGFILRWLPGLGLGHYLRLTIGTEAQNRAVIQHLKEFLEQ
ncbi:hypothetical protein MNBD_ALPHA01-2003 [hydrothermal vent metagenome]|uniref:Histidinol-phosphate transaminase n=1 Tax=hydrothermal vent metagenome TaxID=652676 RepID=A0A3B0SFJ3_9ZZZZ